MAVADGSLSMEFCYGSNHKSIQSSNILPGAVLCIPEFKGSDKWEPELVTSESRTKKRKGGKGKDKGWKRKWREVVAESGPL